MKNAALRAAFFVVLIELAAAHWQLSLVIPAQAGIQTPSPRRMKLFGAKYLSWHRRVYGSPPARG
jgi:hypothetical protein